MTSIKHVVRALMLSVLLTGVSYAQPILDAGWTSDDISAANTDSSASPYLYDLAGPAMFRITDAFVVGDTFHVYDFGSLILSTSFVGFATGFGDDITADSAWTSSAYGSGEVLLGAGAHSLTVQGDGEGGVPAGFYVRLDSVSVAEPSMIALFGLSLLGLGLVRRSRRCA